MIRTPLFALASAVALAAAPLAAAAAPTGDPALDAFQSICVATNNDYLATIKAADAAGWTETDLVPAPDAAISITDKAARETAVGKMHLTLLVSRGLRHTKGGDVPEADCKVSTDQADAGIVDRTKTWLGFAPDGGDATLALFYVKPDGAQPTHIPQSGLNAALAAGGFSVIKAQQDPASAILVYQSFTK